MSSCTNPVSMNNKPDRQDDGWQWFWEGRGIEGVVELVSHSPRYCCVISTRSPKLSANPWGTSPLKRQIAVDSRRETEETTGRHRLETIKSACRRRLATAYCSATRDSTTPVVTCCVSIRAIISPGFFTIGDEWVRQTRVKKSHSSRQFLSAVRVLWPFEIRERHRAWKQEAADSISSRIAGSSDEMPPIDRNIFYSMIPNVQKRRWADKEGTKEGNAYNGRHCWSGAERKL